MWSSIPAIPDHGGSGEGRGALLARILVPLAVIILLFWLGHRRAALVVSIVAGAIVVASLVSKPANRAIGRAGAWLGHVVGRFLTIVLLGATYYVLFAVVSAILRLLGKDPLRTQAEPERPTYWGNLTKPEFPLHKWQFARESAQDASRRGRGLLPRLATAVVALVLINFGLGLFLHAIGVGTPRRPERRAQAAAHANDAWAEAYYSELHKTAKQRYAGFLGWRRTDFSGDYITVQDGVRHSYRDSGSGEGRELDVFFFGGSTMWGVGNRDLHTIPSAFARLAREAGIPVRVTNYGESGYVSWQELIQLSQLCAMGNVPDLAILYDGVNDVFVQIQTPTSEPLPQNYSDLRERFENANNLRKALERYSAFHITLGHIATRRGGVGSRSYEVADLPGELEVLADNAARIYTASVEHARRLGNAYGFEVAAFWQPCVYTKAAIHAGEEPMLAEFGPGVGALYEATTHRVRESTTVIGDALDAVDGPVMVDWCHTNESGSRAVAEAIFARVKPLLERMALDGVGDAKGGASSP